MKFGFDVSGVLCNFSHRAMPDAIETVQALLQQGHEVHSISGGGEIEGEPEVHVLQDYIEAGVTLTSSIWGKGYKAEQCSKLAIDMYFDDSLSNIILLEPPTVGVVVLRAWDSDERVPQRIAIARNWQDIRAAITATAGVEF